ncbi:MAG: ACP S-malonyltransferase [Planctomycetes bacterium]|nr:ACP S-malonyltransferase [Planctomycetota bacterium]
MKSAFIFPGQGAQIAGMAKDVCQDHPVAADLFAQANDILGYDLSKLCFEGPQEKLNETSFSQPAIFTTSAAILEVIRTETEIKPDVTAGLSMGEYTALYAAGLISFEQALVLVDKRGTAMQAAADATEGAMVSIIGLDEEKVNALCVEAAAGELLIPVNYNCPAQIVISGDVGACSRAVELAEKHGAIKAILLQVAGAFHTEKMQSAAQALKIELENVKISDIQSVKVLANINAEYYTGPDDIRKGLVRQLVEPVLWQKCMEKLLSEGVEDYYEIGPGRVLTGLMRRINRKTRVKNVSDLKSLTAILSRIIIKK